MVGVVGVETDEVGTSETVAEELFPPSTGEVAWCLKKAMARKTISERKAPPATKPLSPKRGIFTDCFG
jgi:hypothetical protein